MSQKKDIVPFRIAAFTLSDTRTKSDDEGGRLLVEKLSSAGFSVVSHEILREEPDTLRETLAHICDANLADAIVTTGGTGIAPRDRTIEVIEPMLDKKLAGFGEAFRRLSWDAIGPASILSRALAGVIRGKVIVALPGSPAAITLAVDALIAPTLSHAIAIAAGLGGRHAKHHHDKPSKDEGSSA